MNPMIQTPTDTADNHVLDIVLLQLLTDVRQAHGELRLLDRFQLVLFEL